ncbi:hypothetical protein O181_068790 [Austropuccinia psidii MF-1]|uniref:Uncharacterized protein n=1 Tax=Austropuccinia psidii MF-1 TaxID=1389203 RepID=A0A9Q3I7E3_9BASI|nr:hypothetical protein [Austropuccinia psidii MF-1]
MLSMLTSPHPPPDETPTLPPISALTTPYAYAPPPQLTILTLLRGPQFMPPTPPSTPLTPPRTRLILSAAYHPYARSALPTWL